MTDIKVVGPRRIGLCSILTIIFVIAKIMGYITWSWWMVFSPIWIPLSIIMTIVIIIPGIALAGAFVWICIDDWLSKRKRVKRRAKENDR